MTWILIIVLGASQGGVTSVEFNTEFACKTARYELHKSGAYPITSVCIPKGKA